jgi:hypothetical protein
MSFILNWGNGFGNLTIGAKFGLGTPDSVKLTKGKIAGAASDGSDQAITYTESKNMKIYIAADVTYNLPASSNVYADFNLVIMPGQKSELTGGNLERTFKAEGNSEVVFNLAYSKSFSWDDKIAMRLRPTIKFDILSQQDVSETTFAGQTVKADKGKQSTLTITPAVPIGIQYKASEKLSFYTGSTIKLFTFTSSSAEKGPDGTTYSSYVKESKTNITQNASVAFNIGTSFKLTDALTLDFMANKLLASTFVDPNTDVSVYLTFKK